MNEELIKKVNTLPLDATEILFALGTDAEFFTETVLQDCEHKEIDPESMLAITESVIRIYFNLAPRSNLEKVVRAVPGFTDEEKDLMVENIDYNILGAIDDIVAEDQAAEEVIKEDRLALDVNGEVKPIEKTLRVQNTPVTTSTTTGANGIIKTSSITVENEDLSHKDILGEIEAPTPSFAPAPVSQISTEKPVAKLQVMSKEAQDMMNSSASNKAWSTTKAPSLQEAITGMPDIGGFTPITPVSDPLAPAQKVANTLDSKLTKTTATPVKEVFVPKKIDPYREPIN